jgi:hypothetical protein
MSLFLTMVGLLIVPRAVTAFCNYGNCNFPPSCGGTFCYLYPEHMGSFWDPWCEQVWEGFQVCRWTICWFSDIYGEGPCEECGNTDEWSCGLF